MLKFLKYITSFCIVLITYFLARFLIIELAKAPDGTISDFNYIETGIVLIISLIIGCTALIIATIKENNKK